MRGGTDFPPAPPFSGNDATAHLLFWLKSCTVVGNFILNTYTKFFDDDVIIVTLSAQRTQFTRVLFSTPVMYHNLQVTNSI